MDCKMCDNKISIRHLLSDRSYCEQCECGWVNARYILNGNIKEFIEDKYKEEYWINIEKSEYIK